MAASANRTTPSRHPEAARLAVAYPVKGSTTIYKGTLVMLVAGYAQPAADATGGVVVGVADEKVVNAGSDGDKTIVVNSGAAFQFTGSGIVAGDVGKVAYVTDDSTVQDAATTYGIVAGVIEQLESANVVWIYIPPTNALALTGVLQTALSSVAMGVAQHAIAAGDITATHYDFVFGFTVAAFSVTYRSAAGVPLATTDGATINAGNVRISLAGGGAPALIATDIVAVVASA